VAYNLFPVWSPDGRHIAFAQTVAVVNGDNSGSYRSAIYVVDADGSNLRRLTGRPGTDDIGISWSPDGRYIAYVGLPDGSPLPSLGAGNAPQDSLGPPLDVFVIGADGAGDRNLTNSSANDSQPEWSPDGRRLAYQTSDGGTGYRLTVVLMDGPAAAGPPILGPMLQSYAWAPDGTTLIFVQGLVGDPSAGTSTFSSVIRSVDAELLGPSVAVLSVDGTIPCAPSWQRLNREGR
jgi:TolB protein